MGLDQLAVGPTQLAESRFDVPEGYFAVVLQNGRAVGVQDSGRVGGLWNSVSLSERRLPWTGTLQYMLFAASPLHVDLVERDVPLGDGSLITVRADVRATPAWSRSPSALLEIVRERGIVAEEYRLAASASLQADFRALIRASLMDTGHGDVFTTVDNRDAIGGRESRGIVAISEILDVQFDRDPHVAALDELQRGFAIQAEQARIDEQLFELRSGLDLARAELQSRIDSTSMLSVAQAHQAAAEIYGVPAWAMAYPEQLASARERHQTMVASLLTEYADVIPLMAESMGTTPDGVLRAVLGMDLWGQQPRQLAPLPESRNASQSWGFSDRARTFLEQLDSQPKLQGAAVASTPTGSYLLGLLGEEPPPEGEAVLLLSRASDDQVETAAGMFEVVGRRLGLRFEIDASIEEGRWAIRVVNITQAPDSASAELGEMSTGADSVGAFLAAIAEILGGATPPVALQVG